MTTETTKTEACHDTAVVESRPLPTISSPITLTREQVEQISAGIRAVQQAVEEVVQSWRQVTEAIQVVQQKRVNFGQVERMPSE